MNMVESLGLVYKEDVISNLIVTAINESNNFRKNFLNNLIQIKNLENYNVHAYPRIFTSKGVPDIIISLKNKLNKKDILIIIENKLKAYEGKNQTKRYNEKECINDIYKSLDLNYSNIDTIFLYLTLIPEQIPTGNKFKNITYNDLINKVDIDIEDNDLNKFMKDFYALLKDFYSNLNVSQEDKLLDIFSNDVDSAKLFIKFKNIFKLNKLKNGLKANNLDKSIARGREYFLKQIYKEHWIGEYANEVDGYININANTFNIHFEPNINIMSKKISIPLHYEINPYIPQKILENNCKKEDYINYEKKRNVIKDTVKSEIKKLNDKNIQIGRTGWNQIAKINIDIDENTTVKEFIEKMSLYMEQLGKIVDNALQNNA